MNLKIKSALASVLGMVMLLSNGAGVAMAALGSDLKMEDSDKAKEDKIKAELSVPQYTEDATKITVRVEIKKARDEWKLVAEETFTDFDKGKDQMESSGPNSELTYSKTEGPPGADQAFVKWEKELTDLQNLPKEKGTYTLKITVTVKEPGTTISKTRELNMKNNDEGEWIAI